MTGSRCQGVDSRRGACHARPLARVDALHTALTEIVLEGGDLGRIAARALRRRSAAASLVTSTDGRERAAASPTPTAPRWTRPSCSTPPAGSASSGSARRRAGRRRAQVRSLRVAAGGSDLARLVVRPRRRAGPGDDVHALERAATVAALLITREEAITAVENKYQGDFLRDVFLRPGRRRALRRRARRRLRLGPGPAGGRGGRRARPRADRRGRRSRSTGAGWQERFSAAWRQVTRGIDATAPSVDFSSEVVALLPVAPDDDEPVVRRAVHGVAGDKGGGRRPFSVGVSRVVTGLADLPDAYGQARRARRGGPPDPRRRVDDVLRPARPAPADRAGARPRRAAGVRARRARDLAEHRPGRGRPARDAAGAARHQLQRRRGGAHPVLPLQHDALPRRKLERLLGPVACDPHLRLDVAVALRVLEITG